MAPLVPVETEPARPLDPGVTESHPAELVDDLPPELLAANGGDSPVIVLAQEGAEAIPPPDVDASEEGPKKERRSRRREAEAEAERLRAELDALKAKAAKEAEINPETVAAIRGTVKGVLCGMWDVIAWERGTEPPPASQTEAWADSVIKACDHYGVWNWVNHPLFLVMVQTAILGFAIAGARPIEGGQEAIDRAFANRPNSAPLIAMARYAKKTRKPKKAENPQG